MDESADRDSQTKAALRAEIRARRAGLDPSIRDARGLAIAECALEVLSARLPLSGPVACTWSMRTEPETDPLIARLLALRLEVATPRIIESRKGDAGSGSSDIPDSSGTLEWIPTTADTELLAGPWGIRTPVGDGRVDLASCSVIVLPALALDRHGTRLGQGGGYFDRALAGIATHADGGPLRIAVAYSDEVVERLPRQPHDQGIDLILTESGVTEVASG